MKVQPNWRCENCDGDFALKTGHSHFIINPFGSRTFFCDGDCQKLYEAKKVLDDINSETEADEFAVVA